MKKKIETFVLFVLVVILTVLVVRNFFPKVIDNVIIKEKEVIKVEGQIQYVDGTSTIVKPYAIVLEKINDDWELNADLSYMPMEMSVDNVSYKKEFDWLSPVRIGGEYNFSEGFRPVLGYAPFGIGIKKIRAEIGVATNFRSLGFMGGLRYRNTTLFGSLYLDKSIGVGISFRF